MPGSMDSIGSMFGSGAGTAAPSTPGWTLGGDPGGIGSGLQAPFRPESTGFDLTQPIEQAGSGSVGQPAAGQGFDWMKVIPAAIPAAGGIIGMLHGQGGATDKAIKQMGKATGPIQAAGNQAIGAYNSGTLTSPQQAKVDQFKRENLAKWRQYLQQAGIPEGSAMADIEAKVNTDATAYAEQLLQQDFNNAYQATGLSVNNLTNLARMQAIQDEQQRKSWQDFMAAMGNLGTQIPDWFG